MLKQIIGTRHLGGHRIYLQFDDGVEGEVDVSDLIPFTGVFASLEDEREFGKVRVDPESGTVVWPNGADLDPDVLYGVVTGKPVAF